MSRTEGSYSSYNAGKTPTLAERLERAEQENAVLRRSMDAARAEIAALRAARDIATRVSLWGARPKQQA